MFLPTSDSCDACEGSNMRGDLGTLQGGRRLSVAHGLRLGRLRLRLGLGLLGGRACAPARIEPRVRLPSDKAAISAASGASASRAAAAVASPFTRVAVCAAAAASAIGSGPASGGFVGSAAATSAAGAACPFASIGALIPRVVVDAAHDWK